MGTKRISDEETAGLEVASLPRAYACAMGIYLTGAEPGAAKAVLDLVRVGLVRVPMVELTEVIKKAPKSISTESSPLDTSHVM
jgi:hypothetical protein